MNMTLASPQEMVVQRRHLQPVVQCRTHDWIDLIFEQDDIAP